MAKKEKAGRRAIHPTEKNFWGFVELAEFVQDWADLGLDVENDLADLQLLLMDAPTKPPVVPGAGGLRKARFSPKNWNIGKSGAVRVCYAVFEEHRIVLLVVAYGKSDQDNLTTEEKRGIQRYLEKFGQMLDESREKRLKKRKGR